MTTWLLDDSDEIEAYVSGEVEEIDGLDREDEGIEIDTTETCGRRGA